MARGLSDLQQTILKMAANPVLIERNRQLESQRADAVEGHNLARIERSWIFGEHYGSVDRVNAHQVAVTKALKRLEERGLVQPYSGFWRKDVVVLTADGLVKAEDLLANDSEHRRIS